MRPIVVGMLLLSLTSSSYNECSARGAGKRSRETALRDDLTQMRRAIDEFYAAEKRYPASPIEMVPDYLRKIPADPLTSKVDWKVIYDGAGVIDVRCAVEGVTCDGVPYREL